MTTKDEPTEGFFVSNIFGFKTRQPLVRIEMKSRKFDVTIPPEDARALALNLLACAETAEQDAFMVWFMENEVKAAPPAVAGMLQEFRKWREKRMEDGQ